MSSTTKRPFPNLEIISNFEPKTTERRRMPRLAISGEQFKLIRSGKVYSVTDLTDEGMAFRLLDPEDREIFKIGEIFEGRLNLRGEKHPFRAEVRHVRVDMIGCQFKDLTPEALERLRAWLHPASLGRELRPAPSLEAGAVWYCGPSGTELILHRNWDGAYRRLTVQVLGYFIQWDRETGLTTGSARVSREKCEVRGAFRYETLLVVPDARPDAEKLEIAKTLLLSSNLAQDLVRWCIRRLAPG